MVAPIELTLKKLLKDFISMVFIEFLRSKNVQVLLNLNIFVSLEIKLNIFKKSMYKSVKSVYDTYITCSKI